MARIVKCFRPCPAWLGLGLRVKVRVGVRVRFRVRFRVRVSVRFRVRVIVRFRVRVMGCANHPIDAQAHPSSNYKLL